jgi:hypothetical protein
MPKKKIKKKISKEAEFIKKLICFSEQYIKNDDSELDKLFINQVKRLKKELSSLKT